MLEAPRGSLYPILPLRDIVVFPHMIVPLFVGREKSIHALEKFTEGHDLPDLRDASELLR